MTRRTFKPSGILFSEDDPGQVLYVVEQGHVLVEHTAPNGTPIPLEVLGPDSLVGEDGLVEGADRVSTARAISDISVLSLSRAAYDDLCRIGPQFDYIVPQALAQQNRHLADALIEARHRSPEDRMRHQLQQLGRMFNNDIPLSQATIAGLAGASKATAKGVFNALQGNGSIEILDDRVQLKTQVGLT